jgi:hypothetical protein
MLFPRLSFYRKIVRADMSDEDTKNDINPRNFNTAQNHHKIDRTKLENDETNPFPLN